MPCPYSSALEQCAVERKERHSQFISIVLELIRTQLASPETLRHVGEDLARSRRRIEFLESELLAAPERSGED